MSQRRRSRAVGSRALVAATLLSLVIGQAPVSAAGPVGSIDVPSPIASDADAATAAIPDGRTPAAVCPSAPGRLLVRSRPAVTTVQRTAQYAKVDAHRIRVFHSVPGLELIRTTQPLATASSALRAMPNVISVEPDCIVHIEQTPNDPQFGQQWALANTGQTGGLSGSDLHAAGAWDVRTDASTVVVAVIDTGMQLDHPDLAANLWTNPDEIAGNGIDDDSNGYVDDVHGWDFVNGDAIPSDDNGHGTHVSGTIGARGNNGIGIAGIAWSVKLMPLKAFGANGAGSISSVIAALEYSVDNGARVSNNSYGGPEFARAEYDAFAAAGAAGQVAIAAAGNAAVNTDESPHYPAAFRLDSVVSVAATTNADALASFSDFGIVNVQVAAPGQSILSTLPGSTYGLMSGTSMATPHVAGVAALVAAEHPAWTGSQIRDRLLGTTRDVVGLHGKTWTGGVIDAAAALSSASTVLPPDPPTPTPQALSTTVDPSPSPPAATAPTPPTFPEPEMVESSPRDLGPARIALDATGRPMIAYTRRFDGVHLTTLDHGTWGDRSLTSAYDDLYWLDLALDGSGTPTVAVQRSWSSLGAFWDPGVMLVGATSPNPTIERLTAACPDSDTCYQDWTPALAYDASGAAHTTFTRGAASLDDAIPAPAGSAPSVTGTGTYYATNASGAWAVRRLTTDPSGGPASLAVEPDGTAHIVQSRHDGSRSGLYYVTDDGGSWTSLQLTDHVEDFWSSIRVDTAGGVHLSFARPGFGMYYLHRSPAGTWTAPVRVYDGSAAESRLAVDDDGFAHLAFGLVDGFNSAAGIRYATNRTGSWVGAAVAGGQGHNPDIAVDGSGRAHIAYGQAVGVALGIHYATNTSGAFVSTLARASSSEGGPSRMAYGVDSAGHRHVALASRYGEASVGLYDGTDATGSWVFSRITTTLPDAVAMTIDASDHQHVAFSQGQRLWYASDSTGSWQVQEISPGVTTSPDGVAIALDPAGQPVIVYANGPATQLLRARRISGTWTIDTIYSAATLIREPSVVMGPTGQLHIAIVATLAGDAASRIVYVRGTTGSWSSSSVTPGDLYHFYPSIGRAPDDTIWIADWQADHGILVHHRSTGGSWATTTLTDQGADILPDLVVDGSGTVHVTYSNGIYYGYSGCAVPLCPEGGGLRHAAFDGEGWTVTRVTPYWHDGTSKLAVRADGSVSVLFDRLDMGLRLLVLQAGRLTASVRLQAASDTGRVGDNGTAATTLTYDISFDRLVTGLVVGDLSRTGTATGCTIGAPSGSGSAYTVSVTGCSAGTISLKLAADAVTDGDDATGPATATVAPTVTIDRTVPTATGPVATLRSGAALTGTAIPVRLAWTASDGAGSGIDRYELAQSLDGSATWTTVSAGLSTAAAYVTVPSSGAVRFRVRAVDRAGNVGAWAMGTVLSPRLTQQTSSAVRYLKTWATSTSASFSAGSSKYATAAGASASYRFVGRSVAIVTVKAATRGRVKVYLDGAYVSTVDTYASNTAWRVLVYQKTWATSGTHTIKLVVVGSSGRPRVDLDAIAVMN